VNSLYVTLKELWNIQNTCSFMGS